MFNVGDSHVELVHAAIGTRHAVEHFQTHRTIRWVFRLRAKIPPSHPKNLAILNRSFSHTIYGAIRVTGTIYCMQCVLLTLVLIIAQCTLFATYISFDVQSDPEDLKYAYAC